MNTKKILASILVVLFVASLGAVGVSAAMTFDPPATHDFDEDTTDSTLDLSDYVTDPTGTVTYDYSGNTNIYVSIAGNGVVTFSAKQDWNGNEQITFTATDDNGSINDVMTVTVDPINDAPTLSITDLKAYENVAFTFDVSTVTDDVDTGDSIEYIATTSWTTFAMDANGKISFTPTSDDIGKHSVTITVKDTKSETATKNIEFMVTEITDDGSLVITDVEVDDETGDDDELLPGDWLEVEFDVNNELIEDIDDIKVKAWIEDDTGDRVSDRVESEKFDLEKKGEDDDKALTINIRLPLDADADDYMLVLEASGDTADSDRAVTNLYFEDLNVERNSHDLLIETVTLNPTEAQPGGSLELAVHIYNIGDDEEDDVKIRVRNTELGIDKTTAAFEVEESGSDADIVKKIVVDIPSLTQAGEYEFEVLVTYNEGSDERSSFVPVTVAGEPVGAATITVGDTFAEAMPGQTVKFTIGLTNADATATADYAISISGADNWATTSIEPETATLAPGAEVPVYVYLTPKEGTSGDYTATVNVMSGDATLASKTLSVGVTAAKTTITGLAGLDMTSDTNALAFAIIIIVLVIVAIGLFVARTRAKVEVYGKKRR